MADQATPNPKRYRTWECRIVVPADAPMPPGFDGPPRMAAIDAVEAAGIPVLACFSGWGGELTPLQREIVDTQKEKT